jgi:hypothetical protein
MTNAVTGHIMSSQIHRWRVHLWLIICFFASLGAVLFKLSIEMHAIIGLIFAGLILILLRQRKNPIRGLMGQINTVSNWVRRSG